MKKTLSAFFLRGLVASGVGPVILAVVYLILRRVAAVETLTVEQVCVGIFSLSVLAFLAGGMNVIYQIERLPLMVAILIHGGVLYVSYLLTYLVNGWLAWGAGPILVFSAVFVLGYLAIWAVIYSVTKRRTNQLNAILEEKQRRPEEK